MRIHLLASCVVAALFATASTAGCSSRDTTATGESDHTAREPLTLNDPHVWVDLAESDVGRVIGSAVPRTDPLAHRMQQWLDRYHAIVTQMAAERGERLTAPKPTPGIIAMPLPNAFVTAAIACPTWKLTGTPVSGTPATPASARFMLGADAIAGVDLDNRCVHTSWTDPAAFASFWNRQTHACQLSANGSELTATGCPLFSTIPQGGLATMAVASTIGITLDSLSWGDEVKVATTLAHELGHYYRGHANSNLARQANFFYVDDNDAPVRPVPAAESWQYEQIVLAARSLPAPARISAATKFSKRLVPAVLAFRSACSSATLSDNDERAIMMNVATAQQEASYVAFEAAIDACTAQLPLSNPQVKAILDELLSKLNVSPAIAGDADTIADALAEVTRAFDQVDNAEKLLLDEVTNGNLAWYTDEQEADEVGLELAARAGISPEDTIRASIHLFEQIEAFSAQHAVPSTQVDMATCKRWLAAGFTETGPAGVVRKVRVPQGSLSDPHHANCYRVYNMWRESKRHSYVVASAAAPFEPAWSVIQQRALAAGASRAPL